MKNITKVKEKEEISPKKMIQDVLDKMNWGGTNPLSKSFSQICIGYFYVICSGFIVVYNGITMWNGRHKSYGGIVSDVIIFVGFIQIGMKAFTAIQSKDTLAEMVKMSLEKFWTLDLVDEKTKLDIIEVYKKTNILATIYGWGAMLAVYSISLQAPVGDGDLLMDVPNKDFFMKSPYYEILNFLEAMYFIMSVYTGVVQLDKLFIVMNALVYVQFKMIHMKILAIGKNNTEEENFTLLRDSVIHHNLVLKFVAGFENAYSRLFLPTVASNFILASACMWGFIMDDIIASKVMCVMCYLTVMSQVLTYCIAGQIIQDAGTDVGVAAYNSHWTERHDYRMRMGLIMIMCQSTRKIELTVGGFMILCMENFAGIMKASFSFLAFLINLVRK